MKYTYLLIDCCSVLFPVLFSFHPRLKFYKSWPAVLPAIAISGVVFIAWDMYFTKLKVWGFNPAYLTGVYIWNLPIEELLFFICIPYACMFTYACLPQKGFGKKIENWLSSLLISCSLILALWFHDRYYTACTFALLALLIFTAGFVFKATWLSRFYQSYLILLLPFVLVNGLLTGTCLAAPVVWYNPAEIIGIRILTIPFEDIFYGMGLILLNILIYTWICENHYRRAKAQKKATF